MDVSPEEDSKDEKEPANDAVVSNIDGEVVESENASALCCCGGFYHLRKKTILRKIFFFFLMSYVGERPWWPRQCLKKGRRKKEAKG